jgi:hypothetical protein
VAQRTRNQSGRWALAVVSGVVVMCLLACVTCAVAQPAMQQWPLGIGYSMTWCLLFGGPPTGQVGVKWASPYLSSVLPPFGGASAGCYTTPYLPFLPQRGELVFPP